jgi:hypothetical protein
MDTYFSALSATNVTEAFFFARRQGDAMNRHLFEQLIHSVLHSKGDFRGDRAVTLINLPFSVDEEAWFEEYLTQGSGKNLDRARDTVMMRRIGTGKFKEGLDNGKHLRGHKVDGLDWVTLRAGIENGLGKRTE